MARERGAFLGVLESGLRRGNGACEAAVTEGSPLPSSDLGVGGARSEQSRDVELAGGQAARGLSGLGPLGAGLGLVGIG